MKGVRIGVACAALAAAGAFAWLSSTPIKEHTVLEASAAAISDEQTQETAPYLDDGQDDALGETVSHLFPELDESAITAVMVITPERTFNFRCAKPGKVSVNGQKADAEIFTTLIGQITTIPVVSQAAFTPSCDPMLTLTIVAGEEEFVACFYHDGGTGTLTKVISNPEGEPQYGQTDGWRIGTLLLTCDGTRIQDESGQETPVQDVNALL
ncbi:MAG: hypothetical protein Q4F18_00760 [Clostridia bacterium]|nr:hypothetical protein [Clostridia bacterium]